MIIDNDFGGLKQFSEATKEDVLKLIKKYGRSSDLDDSQNSSPTVREFLELVDKNPNFKFHGYIVPKERTDYRVSLEGFEIKGLSADEALQVMEEYGYADECKHTKEKAGTYEIYTWWD